ncbi:hydrogenase iron-sulfur subunit [Thermodesulfobacteriota bacterium]
MKQDDPRVLCFSCNFGWGFLSDKETLEPATKHWMPVTCSGKIDTHHILKAFRSGVDGVLILGCPEGNCHFQDGNYQAKKRVFLLRKILETYGIEGTRLRMEMSEDPAGTAIGRLIGEMQQDLRELGPVKCA